MPAANLDRRLHALEARLPPAKERVVVLITGMSSPGHRWVPDVFSLPSGDTLTRGEGEHASDFEARVRVAALAASGAPVVFALAVQGNEVPSALAGY